ncbi:response regulator transcription factor [Streptomyces sp. L2]|uniref:response regulator transcription factor n=1 Tax=Streptomyces sp. L2 TaxID=2162665 RepID=UPI0010116D47|nr:response regulator transcription factor [Streptomyces sp. L2]
MIRVLLVHDEHLLRSLLAERLARERDLEVFHTPWCSAPARARSLCPDVCVADLNSTDPYDLLPLGELPAQPAGNGSEGTSAGKGCRSLSAPGACRLLVLTTVGKPGPLRRAAEAHACGYFNKQGSAEQLLTAVRKVADGEQFIDSSLGFAFLKAAQVPLTQRELTVLSLAAEGASIPEIAHSLHLSTGTVRNYTTAIIRKTGARNLIDAIRISVGEGWV